MEDGSTRNRHGFLLGFYLGTKLDRDQYSEADRISTIRAVAENASAGYDQIAAFIDQHAPQLLDPVELDWFDDDDFMFNVKEGLHAALERS